MRIHLRCLSWFALAASCTSVNAFDATKFACANAFGRALGVGWSDGYHKCSVPQTNPNATAYWRQPVRSTCPTCDGHANDLAPALNDHRPVPAEPMYAPPQPTYSSAVGAYSQDSVIPLTAPIQAMEKSVIAPLQPKPTEPRRPAEDSSDFERVSPPLPKPTNSADTDAESKLETLPAPAVGDEPPEPDSPSDLRRRFQEMHRFLPLIEPDSSFEEPRGDTDTVPEPQVRKGQVRLFSAARPTGSPLPVKSPRSALRIVEPSNGFTNQRR